MDYNQILTTLGITQGKLETIIIFTIIALGIGIVCILYWKFLLAGFFALIILFVFSQTERSIEVVAKTVNPLTEESQDQTIKTNTHFDEKVFMEDCLSLANKRSICEDLWKQRSQ
jgi:uncharacterized membrane protein YhiD involved in acid resistance